jgi:hypothetical protein
MIVKECPKHGYLTVDKCFIKTEKRWGNSPKQTYSCKFCKKESSDKYRFTKIDKEQQREKNKQFRKNNRDKILATRNIWKERNREKLAEQERDRRHANPEHFRTMMRKQQSKWRETLDDNYIKAQLARKYKIKLKDVPEWMIPVKRAVIQLRRKIREIQETENDNT